MKGNAIMAAKKKTSKKDPTEPRTKAQSRAEMIERLEALINHATTSEAVRETAKTKLAKLKAKQTKHAERDAENEKTHVGAGRRLHEEDAWSVYLETIREAPALSRLSVSNVFMLIEQATVRGVQLTDVRTYKAWQKVGRQVRSGSKALCMTEPHTRSRQNKPVAPGTVAVPGGSDQRNGWTSGFSIRAKWFDISVTDLSDGDMPQSLAEGVYEPVSVEAALLAKLEMDGWAITYATVADGAIISDDTAKHITVDITDRLMLQAQLAALLVRLGATQWDNVQARKAEGNTEKPKSTQPDTPEFDMSDVW